MVKLNLNGSGSPEQRRLVVPPQRMSADRPLYSVSTHSPLRHYALRTFLPLRISSVAVLKAQRTLAVTMFCKLWIACSSCTVVPMG